MCPVLCSFKQRGDEQPSICNISLMCRKFLCLILHFPSKLGFYVMFCKNGNLERTSWNPKNRILTHWTGRPEIGVAGQCWHWNPSFLPSFSTEAGGSFILGLVAIWLQQLQVSHLDPTRLEDEETVCSHDLLVGLRTLLRMTPADFSCGFLGRTGSRVQAWSSHWWVWDKYLKGVNHTVSEAKMGALLWAIRVNIKPHLGALF